MQQRLQVETGVMQARRSVWESEEVAAEFDAKLPGWRELAIETDGPRTRRLSAAG